MNTNPGIIFKILSSLIIMVSVSISILAQASEFTRLGGWVEGPCNTVAIAEDIGYFGNGCMLEIVDLSDPANPVGRATWETPAFIHDIAVREEFVYIANNDFGLTILDVSTPESPQTVGFLDIQGFYARVLPVGDILYYLTNSSNGLHIVDISDPTQPTLLSRFHIGERGNMAISGNYLYVTARSLGLKVLDISEPASPKDVKTVLEEFYVYDVVIEGQNAYVSDSKSMLVMDISDPENPSVQGAFDADQSWYFTACAVLEETVYIAQGRRMKIVDATDPANPELLASFEHEKGAFLDIVPTDQFICTATEYAGVSMFDMSDPSNPVHTGFFQTAGRSFGITMRGHFAFVANGYDGVRTFDMSDPENPVLIDHFETGGLAYTLRISGEYAYVANQPDGLLVLDIRDPANLVEVSRLTSESVFFDVRIQGDYAYIAQDRDGLLIVDISDPDNPQAVGSLDSEERAMGIAMAGSNAYVANGYGGLWIIDVSDPGNPQTVGSLDEIGFIHSVVVDGGYAYVGMLNPYVKVIDISNATTPVFVSEFFTSRAYDLIVSDLGLVVSAGYNGVYLLDRSDPAALQDIGYYDSGGEVYETFVSGDTFYIADLTAGVSVLQFGETTSTRKIPPPDQSSISIELIFPNPCPDRVQISFSITKTEEVWMRVFDLRGNIVGMISKGRLLPGKHVVFWDGTDLSGHRVPPGQYFIELSTRDMRTVRAFSYIR